MPGISELEDVVILITTLIDSGSKALEDGKINFGDLGYLMEILQAAGPAFAGIENVKAEFLDLDADEKASLNRVIGAKLNMTNKTVETYIEKAFELLFLLGDLINIRS